jgi:RNA-binding protein Nova
MQLSRASEFYPGSPEGQDRILLVSGTVNQLLTALHLVLSKLKAEPGALRAVQAKDGEAIQLRMLVHSRLCGTLIGKGGATIRSFNEDSHAVFNISPPPQLAGLTERIVKITGDVDHLMRAVALVVTKLSENPDYHLLTDANLSYSMRYSPTPSGLSGQQQQFGGPPHGGMGPGPAALGASAPHMLHMGGMGGMGMAPPPAPRAGGASVTMAVPEEKVGVVIGKQGAVINQIKELLGVSIRISKKGEFLPGTHDRACSITGTPEAVEIAQRLIQQKIDAHMQ